MPHDKYNQPLSIGDKVFITGTVLKITSEEPTYCNIIVELDEKMAPDAEQPYSISLSARMVTLLDDPEESASNPVERLAGSLYETYCASVGGVAFNGDPLPDWNAFRGDPSKKKQSDAWVDTAECAINSII